MSKTGTVQTEGANIVYDYDGDGPVLLTIVGAGGNAQTYTQFSNLLADEYTVVRYDRRGNLRSTGDTSVELDMAQSARDAAAVIRAVGVDKALIFANSGGANISLKLAEDLPEVIAGLVAHEPPVPSILPDAEKWHQFNQRVQDAYHAQGVGPAMGLFFSSLVGMDPPSAPGGAGAGLAPGPNLKFFMDKEFVPISNFKPNLDAINQNKVPLITAAGKRSADAYYARTARLIAEKLGCPYVEVPGNHLAFNTDPAAFAGAIREILHRFNS